VCGNVLCLFASDSVNEKQIWRLANDALGHSQPSQQQSNNASSISTSSNSSTCLQATAASSSDIPLAKSSYPCAYSTFIALKDSATVTLIMFPVEYYLIIFYRSYGYLRLDVPAVWYITHTAGASGRMCLCQSVHISYVCVWFVYGVHCAPGWLH
jgi:hypothetical protein